MDEQPVSFIIPRSEHPLSRRCIDPDVLKVLYRLYNHGFLAYLVGGCVRDILLGKTPKDFDVTTDAHPQQIRELFRNSRLIGKRFRLAHVYFKGGKYIEVTTFRRRSEFDVEVGTEHPHSENTFGTPAEDAFCRDITINGVFYNIADFSLVDYVGGLEDLRRGVIRCIGNPEEKFLQDPVRMIRVIRHAARTGFTIEEKTYRSLISLAGNVRSCSPSRVRDEFLRELREGSARESLKLMIETGMLFVLFHSLLDPLSDPGQKEYFLRFPAILDDLILSQNNLPGEFCLALFLLPLLEFFCPAPDLLPGRKGQDPFQQRVREWVLDILGPLQFTRHDREAAAQLLSTQKIFHEFLPERKIPLRILRKPYFSHALHLFKIEARARGENPERQLGLDGGRKLLLKRKKRRRHRRRVSSEEGRFHSEHPSKHPTRN